MRLIRFLRKLLRVDAQSQDNFAPPLDLAATNPQEVVEARRAPPRHVQEPRGAIVDPQDQARK
jgi:hypothetical protein